MLNASMLLLTSTKQRSCILMFVIVKGQSIAMISFKVMNLFVQNWKLRVKS